MEELIVESLRRIRNRANFSGWHFLLIQWLDSEIFQWWRIEFPPLTREDVRFRTVCFGFRLFAFPNVILRVPKKSEHLIEFDWLRFPVACNIAEAFNNNLAEAVEFSVLRQIVKMKLVAKFKQFPGDFAIPLKSDLDCHVMN
ncbi:MAG: hypothetical protein HQ518_25665 [Rhodopirellula sp.]|nr:hypothetical protein [Rhodopirellula sp.]